MVLWKTSFLEQPGGRTHGTMCSVFVRVGLLASMDSMNPREVAFLSKEPLDGRLMVVFLSRKQTLLPFMFVWWVSMLGVCFFCSFLLLKWIFHLALISMSFW